MRCRDLTPVQCHELVNCLIGCPVDGAVSAGFHPGKGCSVWRTTITLSLLFSPFLAADGRVGQEAWSRLVPGDRGRVAAGAVHQSEAL